MRESDLALIEEHTSGQSELLEVLQCASVTLSGGESECVRIVRATEQPKCQRCWRYRVPSRQTPLYDGHVLCERCAEHCQ